MRAKPSNSPLAQEAEQHRAVKKVAKEVAAVLGADFFRSLTTYLAATLHADWVYVAELVHSPADKLRTVAFCKEGAPAQNFSLELAGSAGGQVLIDGIVAWSANVTRLFPEDFWLREIKAEGYIGIRLLDSTGRAMGVASTPRPSRASTRTTPSSASAG